MKLPALSECKPGFRPFEFNVLIAPAEIEEKTAGGLFLPDAVKDMDEMAQVKGVLVDVSPAAFSYHDWPSDVALPKAGDHVIYARYAGTEIEGDDGRKYRLAKDRDIAAVINA